MDRVNADKRPLKTLERVISKAGLGSRTEARRWIHQRRVRVNGVIVENPDAWIDLARDRVLVDDRPLRARERVYILLYKPTGYITTYKDPEGRPTVYDLIEDVGTFVSPVGRLDLDTSGLLLMTNDTQMAEQVTNPASHVPKTYLLKASKVLTDEQLQQLRDGVMLSDGPTRPATVVRLRDSAKYTHLEITLTEGRNRQVRRMIEALDAKVLKLVRVQIGTIRIASLQIGKWRYLTSEEIAAIGVVRPGPLPVGVPDDLRDLIEAVAHRADDVGRVRGRHAAGEAPLAREHDLREQRRVLVGERGFGRRVDRPVEPRDAHAVGQRRRDHRDVHVGVFVGVGRDLQPGVGEVRSDRLLEALPRQPACDRLRRRLLDDQPEARQPGELRAGARHGRGRGRSRPLRAVGTRFRPTPRRRRRWGGTVRGVRVHAAHGVAVTPAIQELHVHDQLRAPVRARERVADLAQVRDRVEDHQRARVAPDGGQDLRVVDRQHLGAAVGMKGPGPLLVVGDRDPVGGVDNREPVGRRAYFVGERLPALRCVVAFALRPERGDRDAAGAAAASPARVRTVAARHRHEVGVESDLARELARGAVQHPRPRQVTRRLGGDRTREGWKKDEERDESGGVGPPESSPLCKPISHQPLLPSCRVR
jgi:pseudouridine synthase